MNPGSLINRLSLQQKFIILTSVSILILMSFIGFIVIRRESSILYNEVERQGRLLVETLAIPVINDLIYERLGLVEEGGLIDNYITEIFMRKDIDLLYIAVLDEKGKVISHNNFKEYGKVYKDPLTLKALESGSTLIQSFRLSETGHGSLDITTPLSIGKKRWGTLKIGVSLEKVEHETENMVSRIIVLTLLILLGGFVIIITLSRRFIGPITHLARTMEKAGGDRLDVKVDIKGHDELALLGESFNRMIDRIKEANVELKRTHEKLLQSEKLASIGILASGVAHEINNPLGGLFNCVQMLEEMGENREFRERYLALLKDGLNRIETTVGKLLWMARSGKREPKIVDVKEAIRDLYGFVEYRLKQNRIEYREKIENDLTLIIDPHDFQQVLINLILNAIHAMKEGGTLGISGYRRKGEIYLEVSDTGEGIEKENLGRIFDPFFTTKQTGEGTGLGLWLTYEIVKNYNGEIFVSSEKGMGTTFTIIFSHRG
jgi:signal transduction histidine kinase